MVERIAKEKETIPSDKKISDGWWQRFLERQPQLSLTKRDSTAAMRLASISAETLNNLEENVIDKPAQLYNVDETGMRLEHRAPNIVAKKGKVKVRYRSAGNKAQTTVVGCVNAVGNAIPPMVIHSTKSLNADWCKCDVPGTAYARSPKGWIDQELF